MTPARLSRHDQAADLAESLDGPTREVDAARGSDRAGRIESDAQLANVAEAVQSERSNGAPVPESTRQAAEANTGQDLKQARVHEGPEAAALASQVGARAFTSGRDVFLGAGESTSDEQLMTHELTHTVQQGMSEAAPTSMGGGAHETAAQQSKADETAAPSIQTYTDDQKIKGQYARVSENGKVVVLGEANYSQDLYATADMIAQANAALASSGEKGSYLSLVKTGGSIVHGKQTLQKVAPVFKPQGDGNNKGLADKNKGKDEDDKMSLWADCGRSSRVVMGSHGDQAPHANYGTGDGKDHDSAPGYNPAKYSDEIYMAAMPPFLQDPKHADYLKKGVHYNSDPSDLILPGSADQARAQYDGLTDKGKKEFDKVAHINTGANPQVGGGYTLNTEYGMPGFKEKGNMTWNFHWAGVVMKDGTDNITLENYADGKGYESINTDWNFQMYGTVKKGQFFHEQHLDSGTHGTKATAFEVEPEGS